MRSCRDFLLIRKTPRRDLSQMSTARELEIAAVRRDVLSHQRRDTIRILPDRDFKQAESIQHARIMRRRLTSCADAEGFK